MVKRTRRRLPLPKAKPAPHNCKNCVESGGYGFFFDARRFAWKCNATIPSQYFDQMPEPCIDWSFKLP